MQQCTNIVKSSTDQGTSYQMSLKAKCIYCMMIATDTAIRTPSLIIFVSSQWKVILRSHYPLFSFNLIMFTVSPSPQFWFHTLNLLTEDFCGFSLPFSWIKTVLSLKQAQGQQIRINPPNIHTNLCTSYKMPLESIGIYHVGFVIWALDLGVFIWDEMLRHCLWTFSRPGFASSVRVAEIKHL